MKKCPYCAEEIQDGAIKCRFCGEFLKKKGWKNCSLGCFTTFILSIALVILFIYLSFLTFRLVTYNMFFASPHLPQYYPPFTGQGIGGIVREFSEVFRALWDRLRDFFHICPRTYYNGITF